MQLCAITAGAFVLALSGALMPGPLFTVTVAESARRGMIAGPLLILGHAILELALIAVVMLGFAGFLKQPPVMGSIALLGGCILIYMGFSMVRSAAGATLDASSKCPALKSNPILSGILCSLSNPYWTLWWSTVGVSYMLAASKTGMIGVAAFFAGHISADLLWYTAISWGVSRGRKMLSDRAYGRAVRICGVLLFGFGAFFLSASASYFGNH